MFGSHSPILYVDIITVKVIGTKKLGLRVVTQAMRAESREY